jgi:hypothetical protein
MTVMSWYDSSGLRGRCDARCHEAAEPFCDCMCGGAYHGSSRNGTFEKVREAHAEVLLEAIDRGKKQGFTVDNAQPVLF